MKPRPHIVHLISALHSGGIQSVVLGMAKSDSLSNFKHSVICVYSCKGNLAKDFENAGIEAHECKLPWLKWPKIPYRLRKLLMVFFELKFRWILGRLLKKLQADIVHTHTPPMIYSQALAILKDNDLPWAWTIHGFFKHKPREIRDWKSVLKLANGKRSFISTVSEAAKADLVHKNIAGKNDIQVIHPGTEIFENGSRVTDGPWRKRLRIPSEAIVFGSLGRVSPEKGFDIFLDAASLLKEECPDFFYLILGDGGSRVSIQAEAKRLGLQERFFILGFDNNPKQFLQELDVFVLPSRTEGFPLSPIEAMSLGLPCIASDVGGVKELIDESVGLLVPSEHPHALAQAMKLMSNLEYRSKFVSGPTIAKKYTYEICSQNYFNVYKTLLGQE